MTPRRVAIEDLLKGDRDERMSSNVYWIIGSELENYASTKALALRVYERVLDGTSADPFSLLNFEYSPVKRLVNLYVREGRRDDARRVLLQFTKPREFPNYDEDYVNQMRMSGLAAAARELTQMGFAADAVPLYSEALAAAESISENGPMYIGNRDGIIQSARKGLDQALQGLKGEQLVQTVRGLLEPPAEVKGPGKPEDRSKPAATKPGHRDQAVDLVLLIYPRDLEKAAIHSMFADSVSAGARDPKLIAAIEGPLKSLREHNPDDLSVRIAAALAAMARGIPGGSATRSTRSASWSNARRWNRSPRARTPTPASAPRRPGRSPSGWSPGPAGRTRSGASTAIASPQRAIDAARRQSDNRWLLAMLRERGQSALDRGNSREVEGDWGRMLDLILARKPEKHGAAGGPRPVPPSAATAQPSAVAAAPRTKAATRPGAVAVAAPAAPGAATRRAVPRPGAGNVSILTLDRFEQAMQVARLAADKGMTALSARALREALKGGPPVVVTNTQTTRRMVVTRAGTVSNEPPDEVTPRVVAQLLGLEEIWRRRKAPADQVYEALRDVAMPEGRPAEVFVYAQSLENGPSTNPRSLGSMLADWAVRAGKADDLRRKIEARRRQPMAEYPATILSAQLAIAGGEIEPAIRALKAISERLKRDTLRPTTELACHVALPALERPETRAAALAVLDACAEQPPGDRCPRVDQVDAPGHGPSSIERRRRRGGPQAARGVPRGQRAELRAVRRRLCALPAQADLADDRRRVRPRRPPGRSPPVARRLPRCAHVARLRQRSAGGRPDRHARPAARRPAGPGAIRDAQGLDDAGAPTTSGPHPLHRRLRRCPRRRLPEAEAGPRPVAERARGDVQHGDGPDRVRPRGRRPRRPGGRGPRGGRGEGRERPGVLPADRDGPRPGRVHQAAGRGPIAGGQQGRRGPGRCSRRTGAVPAAPVPRAFPWTDYLLARTALDQDDPAFRATGTAAARGAAETRPEAPGPPDAGPAAQRHRRGAGPSGGLAGGRRPGRRRTGPLASGQRRARATSWARARPPPDGPPTRGTSPTSRGPGTTTCCSTTR